MTDRPHHRLRALSRRAVQSERPARARGRASGGGRRSRTSRARSHVFETSYAAVDRDLPKLIAKHKPDIVLMFGLAGAHAARAHRDARAQRHVDPVSRRDRLSAGRARDRARQAAARGRAPFARLLGAARATRMPTRLSRDAGRYLCNYVYWRALEASRSGTPLAQFIHIPSVPLVPRRPGRKRRIAHAALARAGEAILLALLAAHRRLPLSAVPPRHSRAARFLNRRSFIRGAP